MQRDEREPGDDDDREDGPDPRDVLVPAALTIEAYAQAKAKAYEELIEVERRRARQPPSAMDAERGVLGSMLLHSDGIDSVEDTGLVAGDFYREAHGMVFAAIMRLRRDNYPVDTITVVSELLRVNQLDAVGGAAAIAQLEAMLPSTAMAATYARMVREKATARGVIDVCRTTIARALIGDGDASTIIDRTQRELGGLDARAATTERDLRRVAEAAMATLPAFGGRRPSFPSGLVDLDKMIGGFEPGTFYVFGGRPSMGKTQVVLDVVRHMAVVRREPVMMFSLEMNEQQILLRLVAADTRIDLRREVMTRGEVERVSGSFGKISESPIEIDDTPALAIGQMRARARAQHRKRKLSAVVVDYIQLLDADERFERGDEKVGAITKGLKALARELALPVIAISQLNRGPESRNDKRPNMGDLRESGNIEADADVIGFLYREEYYMREKTPDAMRNIAEVIVAKNRNGPTGTVRLHYSNEPPVFSNLEIHA